LPHRSPRRPAARRLRWRRWLAAWLLVAIAWPSTGALPWVAIDFDGHRFAATSHDEHAREHGHAEDLSVPGSPLHPADHDCAECTVLKQLSGSVLPAFVLAPPASIAAHVAAARLPAALPRIHFAPLPPPARAPPSFA
jgi:hypothetical protein